MPLSLVMHEQAKSWLPQEMQIPPKGNDNA
jgi:hypothetical protein